MRERLTAFGSTVIIVLALQGCGNSKPPPFVVPSANVEPGSHPTKTLLIIEENAEPHDALAQMPALARLAHEFGYTTRFSAEAHPSLPNYLALIAGSSLGVSDDRDPVGHSLVANDLLDEGIASGGSAKVYAEGMQHDCATTSSGNYLARHNPWTYFATSSARANCGRFDVPAGTRTQGAFASDVRNGELPTVGMLVPDRCHDGHDCALSDADRWLSDWLSIVFRGADWADGHLSIVITFDEDDGGGDNRVLTVGVAPEVRHKVVTALLNHYSWTRYAASLLKVPAPGAAAQAPSLGALFGF